MARDISKMMKIEDETGWQNMLEASDKMLVILDVHQDWCGPCEAIHPTLLRVFAVRWYSNEQYHSYPFFTSEFS